jgi:hypothetical protein
MTEQEWLDQEGFNEGFSGASALMFLGITVAAITAMKHFSDVNRTEQGKPQESWIEWFTRGF